MAQNKVVQIQSDMVALRVEFFDEFAAGVAHEMSFLADFVATVEADLPR